MYKLFIWSNYYPAGGLNDLKGEFDSVEGALEHVKTEYVDGASQYSCGGEYQIVNADFTVETEGTW